MVAGVVPFRVEPFAAEHLLEIKIQDAQLEAGRDWLALGQINEASGQAFTARGENGAILMCGGAVEVHADYASLWAVFADAAGPQMLGLTRRTRWVIDRLRYRRIDAMVPIGFLAGHRWAAALGLREEATLAAAFPDGRDARIYRKMGEQ